MKRVYWRPRKVSKVAILAVGVMALAGSWGVRQVPRLREENSLRKQMLQATWLAESCFEAIREARLQRGHVFPERFDPGQTGMLGVAMSPATSLPASLAAKQTSVNPNFAAAFVDMLSSLELQPGDCIAVGYTGSFPAFNTCLAAAIETMELQPIVIHSIASSQYGANQPDMLWLDMEAQLRNKRLISFTSSAASLGSFGDRGVGMSNEAQELLWQSADRHGVPRFEVNRLAESIERRMEHYAELAGKREVKAYINVGGGAASIRGSRGKDVFSAGITRELTPEAREVDCVMTRFAAQGVPVVHLGDAEGLAETYGFPEAPQFMPLASVVPAMQHRHPPRLAAGVCLLGIAGALWACIWSGPCYRASEKFPRLRLGTGTNIASATEENASGAELMV